MDSLMCQWENPVSCIQVKTSQSAKELVAFDTQCSDKELSVDPILQIPNQTSSSMSKTE